MRVASVVKTGDVSEGVCVGTLRCFGVVMRGVLFVFVALVVMARGVDVRDPSFPVCFPKSLARMLFVSLLFGCVAVSECEIRIPSRCRNFSNVGPFANVGPWHALVLPSGRSWRGSPGSIRSFFFPW